MTSRRRAGNTGNSSPAVARAYDLRNRTKNVGLQSPESTLSYSETNPQTSEPGSKGDISRMVRPVIKNSEKKDQPVELKVKDKPTRRTTKPVESDVESEASDRSTNSSRKEFSEEERQSYIPPSTTSSRSSTRRQTSQPRESQPRESQPRESQPRDPQPRESQPRESQPRESQPRESQPREFYKYTDDDAKHFLGRPPIGSYAAGRAKNQPPQTRPHVEYTNDDEEEVKYHKGTWRARTENKRQPSQSSSEDDEGKTFQPQQKPKAPLYETSRYKEERETWSSTNRGEQSIFYQSSQQKPRDRGEQSLYLSSQQKPRDRGEESILYQRSQQKPRDYMKTEPAPSRSLIGFSDDEEEKTRKRAFLSRPTEGVKMNHYPEKNVKLKANIVAKPHTKSFIHLAGTCMKYLLLVLLFLLLGLAAVFYISPESVLKITDQLKLRGEPQVKKDLKDDFGNLSGAFTNQDQQMWQRSKRILERHLENWKGNTEPAIILLTGAQDAEQTLLCVGTKLADIYSSSLSGNYTVISGSDWASKSNEEVKEYIDDELSTGFRATTRAAVLHRLELLPAGSLLILYKYCDHESAVYKNVALLLTVLLDDATLEKNISFKELEEKVREFLIQKVVNSDTVASYNVMDEDKFSGVWSRISHVVLPVFPETNHGSMCPGKHTKA